MYTQGTWNPINHSFVEPDEPQWFVHADDDVVADSIGSEADARLIAAAPELLHELRLLNVDENGEQKRNTPAWRAIAKATGR